MGNPVEWVWADLYAKHPRVRAWDATNLTEVPDGTVEHLYTSHLLEHLPHAQVPAILAHWHSKLTPDGVLTLGVPDLYWASRVVVSWVEHAVWEGGPCYTDFATFQSVFFGNQHGLGETHRSGFTQDFLGQLLEEAGFSGVTITRAFEAHQMGCLLATARA
jgi:predicted SAM-dependent methyltransferase